MRQLLTESAILGLVGGAAGLAIAAAAVPLLVSIGPAMLPRLDEISADARAGWFTLLFSVVAGLLSGALPAAKYVRARMTASLRSESRTASAGRDRGRARNWLVAAQVALSVVLLIVVGIYGVVSYAVSQRRREMGIHLALGAHPGRLSLRFVRQSMMWAGVGVLIGLAASAALTKLMTALLFGVTPLDPATYAAVAAILLGAAALASYIPARQAALINPAETLRVGS